MNKKIIALLTAICCIAAPLTAFADADYNPNDGVIEGAEAPSAAELRNMENEARKKNSTAKMKEISKLDYSTYVAETDNITVTIDENDMWKASKEVLGIQAEYSDSYSRYFENGMLKQEYIDFTERTGKIPVLRLGGGSVMGVNFMNHVGPYSDRKQTPKEKVPGCPNWTFGGAGAYRMGVPEYLRMLYQNNPDGELMPCVNIFSMTPEDMEHFAHYLLDKKDESEWGALRAADGIEEPVKVWYWELANEVDGWGKAREKWRIEGYIKYARAAAEAIRKVDPNAKIMANGPTAPWGDFWNIEEYTPASWTSWHMGILPGLVDIIDGIAMHPYYDGYSPEFGGMYFADKVKADVDKMVEEQDIRDENGNLKDIEIIATEHNRFVDLSGINNDFNSAMSVAQFWNLVYQRPWFTGGTLHNLDGQWCAFWQTGYGGFVMTPTAKLQKLYMENLGDRICKSSWLQYNADGTVYDPTDDPYFLKDDFSVMVSANGDHELKVFLNSKKPYRNINVTFDFLQHKNYTLVNETILKAPNSATYPIDRETEDLVTVTTNELNIPNCSTYTTPTEGVAVLTFKTSDRLLKLGEDPSAIADGQVEDAPDVEEAAFADIDGSYAKNEISALAGSGLLKGRTENEFAPKDNISRAELAVMLVNALKLKTYDGSMWDDVTADAWYAPYANALYIAQVMQGSNFRAADGLSVNELMIIAGNICMKNDDAAQSGEISGAGSHLDAPSAYAVSKGLFSKLMSLGDIDTSRAATREDAAAVMYKLSKMVK